MNQSQIDCFPTAVFPEQHEVLVRAPDGFFHVTTGFLDVLVKLALLRFIQAKVALFILDVFPRQHLSSFVAEGIRRVRNRPN